MPTHIIRCSDTAKTSSRQQTVKLARMTRHLRPRMRLEAAAEAHRDSARFRAMSSLVRQVVLLRILGSDRVLEAQAVPVVTPTRPVRLRLALPEAMVSPEHSDAVAAAARAAAAAEQAANSQVRAALEALEARALLDMSCS